ncbi:MBOAT family O-acyltransferase [Stakelama marina]|uniref:Acyltransferase n=1 Tax=Stakelama marina TaxID=2826939 RepID=A0A8T4IH40_9SPHN|nr:MBOAT family O-acyltransferase [Stakelama marina]MBR0553352.1 hypothetical protein [Stakelama marina]
MTSSPALSLRSYVKRRLGVPLGAPGSLSAMGRRAFGARSFAGFWLYWNPIFGYGLGRYIFTPLRRAVPRALALLGTFVFCGMLHDAVTLLVRGSTVGLFTAWFAFLAIGVLVGEAVGMNLSRFAHPVRAGAHISYIATSLGAALAVTRSLAG